MKHHVSSDQRLVMKRKFSPSKYSKMPSREYLSTPPPLAGGQLQNGSALANVNQPLTPSTPKRPEKKSSLYKTELCRSWEETGQCR